MKKESRTNKTLSLAQGITIFLAQYSDSLQPQLLQLWKEWDTLFGTLGKELVPLGHTDNTLILGVFSSAALQEYLYYAEQILEPVNRFLQQTIFQNIRIEMVGKKTPLNRLPAKHTVRQRPLSVPKNLGKLNLPQNSPVGKAYTAYVKYVQSQNSTDQ